MIKKMLIAAAVLMAIILIYGGLTQLAWMNGFLPGDYFPIM